MMGGGGTSLKDAYGDLSNTILTATQTQVQAINNAIDQYTGSFNNAMGMLNRQFEEGRSDLAPYRNFGINAMGPLQQLLGLSNGTLSPEAMSKANEYLQNTPGYQFAYTEGLRSLNAGQAARGMLNSGEAMREEQQFGQGLASQNYQQAVGNLLNVSQVGSGAASQSANMAAQQGQVEAGLQTQFGENMANSQLALGNAISQGMINSMATKYAYITGAK